MSSTRPGDLRATSAANAAELLQGDEPGVLLVGPAAQTSRTIRLILDQLSDRSVMPIGFMASGATPAMLRQEVGQAHAARPSPDTDLLLVVAQADRLSPDLLHELEMAAEAAATHGGLKFLFAAPRDLSASLQRAELWSLAACVRTRLPVLSPTTPLPTQGPTQGPSQDTLPEHDAGASARASESPYPFSLVAEPLGVARHTRQARPVPRVMLAVGILGILSLAVTGILVSHQPGRPVALDRPAAPVTPAPPPAASTIRLPIVPDAVPPASSPEPTTPSPEPRVQAPPAAAAPAPASPAPVAPPVAVAPLTLPQVAPPQAAAPQATPLEVVAPQAPPPVAQLPAAPPRAIAPPPEPAALPAAAPVPSPTPTEVSPSAVPSNRIDTGRIVPQLAPARHASLLLLAGPDDTLPSLYAQVYRGTTPPSYGQVATLNPVVRSGVRLVFPAPPTGWPAASPLP